MTGSQFLSYVKQIFKRTDKDTEIYTAIADTIMDMRARMKSDEHMTVSSALTGISAIGDYTLNLPSDFGHLIGDVLIRDTVSDSPYLPLKKITKEEYDREYSQNLASTASLRHTGVPIHYAYYGQRIYLGPAVDKTGYEFKINYTIEDTPSISGSTDPVPFTDQFREVLREGVLMRMFNEMENYAEGERRQFLYEQGVRKIIENDMDYTETSDEGMQYQGI